MSLNCAEIKNMFVEKPRKEITTNHIENYEFGDNFSYFEKDLNVVVDEDDNDKIDEEEDNEDNDNEDSDSDDDDDNETINDNKNKNPQNKDSINESDFLSYRRAFRHIGTKIDFS